jgi:hypothetical protein
VQRRHAIVCLAAEGWTSSVIAAYLEVSRQTAHETIARWNAEG